MKHSENFIELVQDAKKRIQEIECLALDQKLRSKEPFLLIDVREDEEWARGRIPKAIHLSKGILERDIDQLAPDKSKLIILYCGGGYRSALAADNLQKMEFTQVFSLKGGIREWLDLDLPIEN